MYQIFFISFAFVLDKYFIKFFRIFQKSLLIPLFILYRLFIKEWKHYISNNCCIKLANINWVRFLIFLWYRILASILRILWCFLYCKALFLHLSSSFIRYKHRKFLNLKFHSSISAENSNGVSHSFSLEKILR